MKRRSWGVAAVVALAWGCDGEVSVGNLAGSSDAGSTDGAAPTISSHTDGASEDSKAADGAPDSSQETPASNVTTYFLTLAEGTQSACGNRCLCLPGPLPTDAAGQAACQLFFLLAAGDTCTANSLVAAGPDVSASVAQWSTSPPAGEVCVVPQLPTSQWVNGSCVGSSQRGWCYVTDAAAGNCRERVTTSATTVPPTGAEVVIGCGDTPAGTPAATSAAHVGAACVPSPELSPTFGGFRYTQVSLDENNAACGGDVCLVNHFQGLTSCPYGQDQTGQPPRFAMSACTVPGTGTPVQPDSGAPGETVNPWCTDRTASDAVYCSCRCANAEGNTSDGVSYCACPTGYTCSQVVPAVVSGDPRAGGYCIKANTAYDANSVCATECVPGNPNCQ